MTDIQKYENNKELVQQKQPSFTMETAEMLVKSNLFGTKYKKPEEIMAVVLMGQQQGLDPMTALQNGYSIQGRFDFEVKTRWARVQTARHPNGTKLLSRFICKATNETSCTVILERQEQDGSKSSIEQTYTIEQAKKAGLTTKGVWTSHPAKMLFWRALGNAIDILFPDVRLGLHDNYENLVPENPSFTAKADEEPEAWNQVVEETPAIEIKEVESTEFISEAQRKRLFAIAKGKDRLLPVWTEEQVKDYLATLKISSTSEIPKSLYEQICNTLEGAPFEIDVPGQVKLEVK